MSGSHPKNGAKINVPSTMKCKYNIVSSETHSAYMMKLNDKSSTLTCVWWSGKTLQFFCFRKLQTFPN